MIFYLLGLLSYYRLNRKPVPRGVCLLFFAVLSIPPVTTVMFFVDKHWIFQLIAFACGLIFWTFIEYYLHRFIMHDKNNKKYNKSMHFYHHTHPEKIFASRLAGKISIVTAIICIGSGLYISPELFFLSGIVTGIAVYLHMHAWLHQPWAAKRLKKLQNAHMQHHCGETEKYFGVITTFWDHLFNTTGNEETKITVRKREFYFTRTTSLAKSA